MGDVSRYLIYTRTLFGNSLLSTFLECTHSSAPGTPMNVFQVGRLRTEDLAFFRH